MKTSLCLLLSFLLATACFAAVSNITADPEAAHPLLPMPVYYTSGSSTIQIKDPCNFSFDYMTKPTIPQVAQITALYKTYMFKKGCKTMSNSSRLAAADPNSVLHVHIDDVNTYLMNTNTNESYSLLIQDGFMTLNAATYIGFVRGLETFSQLISTTILPNKSVTYSIQSAPITINDKPRFPHRGLLLDTSRHFIPKSKIFQVMDGMLAAKLNVFHWHITDSDSFPIYLPSHPNLSKYGAYSEEETYTQQDVKEIVDYAILRGIRIIPEVDSPSHTASWGRAPEASNLVFCYKDVWYKGIPIGLLDPTKDDTYKLFADIFNDLKTYFPWDSVHLGGDEVNQRCWSDSQDVKNFMTSHNISSYNELLNYYLNRVKTLVDSKKTRFYWMNQDATYLTFQQDEVLQWWGSTKDLPANMNKFSNQKYVLSNFDYFYLDCGAGGPTGGQAWCNPLHTWWDIYSFEPSQVLTQSQLSRVLGLEVALWSEMNDASSSINKIFPRTASLAEKTWSSASNVYTSKLSVFSRLVDWRRRMTERGVEVQPVGSGYCEHNPKDCL